MSTEKMIKLTYLALNGETDTYEVFVQRKLLDKRYATDAHCNFTTSSLISDSLEGNDEDDIEIPITVAKPILDIIIRYQTQNFVDTHDDPCKPLKSNILADNINKQWVVDLVKDLPQEQKLELAKAVNYLGIPSLLKVACANIATLIKGKTPEEIRRTFNITEPAVSVTDTVSSEEVNVAV